MSSDAVQCLNGDEVDVEFLKFKQLQVETYLKVSKNQIPERSNISLLCVSSKYGYVIFGTDTGLSLCSDLTELRSKIETSQPRHKIELESLKHVPLSSPPSHIRLNADETKAFVVTNQTISLFSVSSLLSGLSDPVWSCNMDASIEDIAPNPESFPDLVAVLCSNGDLTMIDTSSNNKTMFKLPEKISCMSWSRKGKQICCGSQSGKLYQVAPDGKLKKEHPRPPEIEHNVKVQNLFWIEDRVFLAMYASLPTEEDELPETDLFTISQDGANAPHVFTRLMDPASSFGDGSRPNRYFMELVPGWENQAKHIIIFSNVASTDVGVVACDTSGKWCNWMLPEGFTITLPLDDNELDTWPVGMAIDFTAQDPIPGSIAGTEQSIPPCPMLYILNNDGCLLTYRILNVENDSKNPGMVTKLETLPSNSGTTVAKIATTAALPNADAKSIAASPFSLPKSGSSPFSQTGFGKSLTTPKADSSSDKPSGFGFASNASSFGQPSFGTSAFGIKPPEISAKPFSFKSNSQETTKTAPSSPFGSSAAKSSGFGFGAVSQSPFKSNGSESKKPETEDQKTKSSTSVEVKTATVSQPAKVVSQILPQKATPPVNSVKPPIEEATSTPAKVRQLLKKEFEALHESYYLDLGILPQQLASIESLMASMRTSTLSGTVTDKDISRLNVVDADKLETIVTNLKKSTKEIVEKFKKLESFNDECVQGLLAIESTKEECEKRLKIINDPEAQLSLPARELGPEAKYYRDQINNKQKLLEQTLNQAKEYYDLMKRKKEKNSNESLRPTTWYSMCLSVQRLTASALATAKKIDAIAEQYDQLTLHEGHSNKSPKEPKKAWNALSSSGESHHNRFGLEGDDVYADTTALYPESKNKNMPEEILADFRAKRKNHLNKLKSIKNTLLAKGRQINSISPLIDHKLPKELLRRPLPVIVPPSPPSELSAEATEDEITGSEEEHVETEVIEDEYTQFLDNEETETGTQSSFKGAVSFTQTASAPPALSFPSKTTTTSPFNFLPNKESQEPSSASQSASFSFGKKSGVSSFGMDEPGATTASLAVPTTSFPASSFATSNTFSFKPFAGSVSTKIGDETKEISPPGPSISNPFQATTERSETPTKNLSSKSGTDASYSSPPSFTALKPKTNIFSNASDANPIASMLKFQAPGPSLNQTDSSPVSNKEETGPRAIQSILDEAKPKASPKSSPTKEDVKIPNSVESAPTFSIPQKPIFPSFNSPSVTESSQVETTNKEQVKPVAFSFLNPTGVNKIIPTSAGKSKALETQDKKEVTNSKSSVSSTSKTVADFVEDNVESNPEDVQNVIGLREDSIDVVDVPCSNSEERVSKSIVSKDDVESERGEEVSDRSVDNEEVLESQESVSENKSLLPNSPSREADEVVTRESSLLPPLQSESDDSEAEAVAQTQEEGKALSDAEEDAKHLPKSPVLANSVIPQQSAPVKQSHVDDDDLEGFSDEETDIAGAESTAEPIGLSIVPQSEDLQEDIALTESQSKDIEPEPLNEDISAADLDLDTVALDDEKLPSATTMEDEMEESRQSVPSVQESFGGFSTQPKNTINPMFGFKEPPSSNSLNTTTSLQSSFGGVSGNNNTLFAPSKFGSFGSSNGFGNSSFSTPSTNAPSSSQFGAVTKPTTASTNSAFGGIAFGQSGFGNTSTTSFGNAGGLSSSFAAMANSVQSATSSSPFGSAAQTGPTSFGSVASAGTSVFGNTNTSSSGFGASSGFGSSSSAPAPTSFLSAAQNPSVGVFGQSSMNNSNQPFGSQTAFGSSQQTPAAPATSGFGSSGFSSSPGFGFGANSSLVSSSPYSGLANVANSVKSSGFGGFANTNNTGFGTFAQQQSQQQNSGFGSIASNSGTQSFGSFGGSTTSSSTQKNAAFSQYRG